MSDAPEGSSTAVARRWHLVGLAVLTLIGFYGVVESLRLGVWRQNSPGEGLFPFLAALAMTLFALFCAAAAWRRPPAIATGGPALAVRQIAIYVAGLVFYAAALDALGFILSTVVAVVFILRVGERYSWLAVFALAIGTAVGCQVLFVVWLGAILPTGFLWDALFYPS